MSAVPISAWHAKYVQTIEETSFVSRLSERINKRAAGVQFERDRALSRLAFYGALGVGSFALAQLLVESYQTSTGLKPVGQFFRLKILPSDINAIWLLMFSLLLGPLLMLVGYGVFCVFRYWKRVTEELLNWPRHEPK